MSHKPPAPQRFSKYVETQLRNAGWFPGRRAELEVARWTDHLLRNGGFQSFRAANDVLGEFGGLRLSRDAPGSQLRYGISLDPSVAAYERDRFAHFERELDTGLYPIGELDDGHLFLAVDRSGATFGLMDRIWLVARQFDDALGIMITGNEIQLVDGADPWV